MVRSNPLLGGIPPTHPGVFLRQNVEASGKTQKEMAELLGMSVRALIYVMDGARDMTPALALKVGKLFGSSPLFWMNLQTEWDLVKAREEIGPELAAIKQLKLPAEAAAAKGAAPK